MLPYMILTSDTGWYPSVLDSTKSEDNAWFITVFDSSKLESHGPFDMLGDYVDRTIVQYTELYCSYYNNNDGYYNFTINSYVLNAANFQDKDHNLLLSSLFKIPEHGVQHKERDYNSLRPLFC